MLMQIFDEEVSEYGIAKRLDQLVVKSATEFKSALLEVYHRESWKYLGYENWGEYLKSVAERAQYSTSMLRRWTNAAALTDAADKDIDTFSEGALREITEGLSDGKGFSENQRIEALMKAVEYAGNDTNVTSAHTRKAVAYTLVNESMYYYLSARMREGEISPEKALQILRIIDGAHNYNVQIIGEYSSDPRLVKVIANLSKGGGDTWEDLANEIMSTHHVPAGRGKQIPLADATAEHLLGYLNEPNDLARADAIASEREQTLARWREAFAEVYDLLEWLVYLANDVGKSGGSPELGEFEHVISLSTNAIEETKNLRAKAQKRRQS